MDYSILIGKGDKDQINLRCAMANRHGLIAGATGTGKTVTLKVLAEGFSKLGVPVFMADVKGDLAGLAFPGTDNPKIKDRIAQVGVQNYTLTGNPVVFWDVLGEQGHPARATVSEVGPLLFSRLLELNDTQEAVLNLVFKIADDQKLLLLDLKDLQAMVTFVGDHAKELDTTYGNIATATIGAIQRGLVTLGQKGGDKFFGEPALNIDDLIQTIGGQGVINILAADKLMQNPIIYSTFLLWLLADLFEHLPEVGDLDKPKLVFFFDEAHLLFNEAPKALLEKIEQVVRLIRSKGVGVYFVTQSPLDVPDTVLGQLGNRVQHALHAFTPRDQKAVRAAAETFRSDGNLDVADVIMNLNVGEALVSVLDEKGAPTVVERAWIAPPQSRFGAISPEERKSIIEKSTLFGHYEKMIDRESAYEILKKKAEAAPDPKTAKSSKPGLVTAFLTSAVRTMGTTISRTLVRGILDSLIKGGSKR